MAIELLEPGMLEKLGMNGGTIEHVKITRVTDGGQQEVLFELTEPIRIVPKPASDEPPM